MSEHKYILKPYKGPATRYTCPGCGHKHKFSRYVDTSTGNELADHVGRCDRENNCGYHYTPKMFFTENPNLSIVQRNEGKTREKAKCQMNKPVDYLPFDLMYKSVSLHKECSFYPFLVKLFKQDIADQLCRDYFIGKSKAGFTIFWRVDIIGRVTQGNMIHYINGHRDKETILHSYVDKEGKLNEYKEAYKIGKSILRKKETNIVECFFGEHLLSFPQNIHKPVAIVESEKTAVIASIYFPEFLWLATGGKHGVKMTERSVCKVLTGKKVILFPDLNAYDSWKAKGLLMAVTAGCKVVVSDLLEINASDEERIKGLDLADYLLRVNDGSGLALTDHEYPVMWDYSNKAAKIIEFSDTIKKDKNQADSEVADKLFKRAVLQGD